MIFPPSQETKQGNATNATNDTNDTNATIVAGPAVKAVLDSLDNFPREGRAAARISVFRASSGRTGLAPNHLTVTRRLTIVSSTLHSRS